MDEIETGGPAFPADHHAMIDGEHGMTLRDYFAAKALHALLLNKKPHEEDEPGAHWAEDAYYFADAMMKVRNAK